MSNPLSFVHPDAKIGANVQIGPFVAIHENVEIGEGTVIHSNAVILPGARIGKNCKIHSGAVIAGVPQDLKFKGEETLAIIGDNTTIREFVTVNRGTASKGKTVIGNNCLIMAYCHVAHDCLLHDNIIMPRGWRGGNRRFRRSWRRLAHSPVLAHRRTRHDSGRLTRQQGHSALRDCRT